MAIIHSELTGAAINDDSSSNEMVGQRMHHHHHHPAAAATAVTVHPAAVASPNRTSSTADCLQNVPFAVDQLVLLYHWCRCQQRRMAKLTEADAAHLMRRRRRDVRLVDGPRRGEAGRSAEWMGRGMQRRKSGRGGEGDVPQTLQVTFGGIVPLQQLVQTEWRNGHQEKEGGGGMTRNGNGDDEDQRFRVVNAPKHGEIVKMMEDGGGPQQRVVQEFTLSDVLAGRIFYKNIGKSSAEQDNFRLRHIDEQIDGRRVTRKVTGTKGGSNIHGWRPKEEDDGGTIGVNVNVQQQQQTTTTTTNAPPQLLFGQIGPILHIKRGSRIQLNDNHLRIFDSDTLPARVWLYLEEISANLELIDRSGMRLRRASLAQFNMGEVHLLALDETMGNGGGGGDDGNSNGHFEREEGHATFVASDDSGAQSVPLTLRVVFAPLKIVLDRNMGIRLSQHFSQHIEPTNLHSHCANPTTNAKVAGLFAHYSIVDQPEFGVIECSRQENRESAARWTLCSEFSQSDIDALAVRYRHINANQSRTDSFNFQIHCADSSSPVQVFQIDFITVSIRVFVQEALRLNRTEQGMITRRNMLATVFPQNFQPNQLIFQLLEAPKLGMLLRLVPETGKQRRVGVSSNFTQQQIDDGLLSYKLHFAPFSVLNDFFTFRLITPAAISDEIFRFDIVYLPGGGIGEIRLLNRTLIVTEGGIQQITNNTLWLEAADGTRQFVFRIALPPLNGHLLLGNKIMSFDDTFRADDILNQRVFYQHSGDESRWDRVYILAENELRDPGGGKGHTPLPFFFTISIHNQNNRPPQPLHTIYGGKIPAQIHIYLLENGERTLSPSLLPLADIDEFKWPSKLEQSKFYPVARSEKQLYFNVLPESSNSRTFVICAKHAPEMPLREFDEKQLSSGQLIIRHLGSSNTKNVATFRLTVNDGYQNTPLPISLIASEEPFIRLATFPHIHLSPIFIDDKQAFFPIRITHLWAETNLDVSESAIIYQIYTLIPNYYFKLLLSNGTFVEARQFTQMDIWENRLFYSLNKGEKPRGIFLRILIDSTYADNIIAEVVLNISFTDNSSFPFLTPVYINNNGLIVQSGGSAPIYGNLFAINTYIMDDVYAKFYIVRMPRHGEIVFQRQRVPGESLPSANYNIPVLSFDNDILQFGSIQYLHNDNFTKINHEEIGDDFELNVVFQSKQNKNFLFHIGHLFLPIHIIFGQQQQTLTQQNVLTYADNTKKVLKLKKNKQMQIDPNMNKTFLITSDYLQAQSSIIPTKNIHFLIWQQQGGVLYLEKNSLYEPSNNFTQEDLNLNQVKFKIDDESRTKRHAKIGFYFLYCDGINELGPEWFSISIRTYNDNTLFLINDNTIKSAANKSKQIQPIYGNLEPIESTTQFNLPLQLRNFTVITLQQGKTYVLLNRGHLGTEFNGDRAIIIYNITKTPENGTFYWVDGEKEAITFTQDDIDNGQVLYAQMNMNAYEDSFEFVISNDEIELLPKKGIIKVLPVFSPQSFYTKSRVITQLGIQHFNASALEGTSPRFIVVTEPKYGRLFLRTQINESAVFFTHTDVSMGRLFFHAYDVPNQVIENIELELRSESVQPARMVWTVYILPNDETTNLSESISFSETNGLIDDSERHSDEEGNNDKVIISPPPPDMNYHFPIAILIAVVALVVGILLCRRRDHADESSVSDNNEISCKKSSKDDNITPSSLKSSIKKKSERDGNGGSRFLIESESSRRFGDQVVDKRNLLDSTVYATINCRQLKDNHGTFQKDDPNIIIETESNDRNDGLIDHTHSSQLPFNLKTNISTSGDSALHLQRNSIDNNKIPSTGFRYLRSESRERQQLLASAVLAALTPKNIEVIGNEKSGEDAQQTKITSDEEGIVMGKNEFWV